MLRKTRLQAPRTDIIKTSCREVTDTLQKQLETITVTIKDLKGKKKMVALTALMGKIIVIANARIRDLSLLAGVNEVS